MINLPTAESKNPIECVVERDPKTNEFLRWVVFTRADGMNQTICTISAANQEAAASDIAKAIEEARDIGYDQGIESIRKAFRFK